VCPQVFQPETLGHRQGLLCMLLPTAVPKRCRAVCELRKHEGLRPRRRAISHELESLFQAGERPLGASGLECDDCLCLGRLLPISLAQQLVARLLQLRDRVLGAVARGAKAEQHVRTLRVLSWPEIECEAIEARGGCEGIEGERTVAGASKRAASLLLERRIHSAG